jgi:hypothetical protein
LEKQLQDLVDFHSARIPARQLRDTGARLFEAGGAQASLDFDA